MKTVLFVTTLVLTSMLHAGTSNTSKYTSLKENSCRVLEDSSQDPDSEGDYYEARCSGKNGFAVHFTSGDARSWLVFKKQKTEINTYEMVMSRPSGFFPNVSGEKVEWRYSAKGELKAVIFRVATQDQEDYTKSHSDLFVVKLEGAQGCLLGVVKTNLEARSVADTATKCLPTQAR